MYMNKTIEFKKFLNKNLIDFNNANNGFLSVYIKALGQNIVMNEKIDTRARINKFHWLIFFNSSTGKLFRNSVICSLDIIELLRESKGTFNAPIMCEPINFPASINKITSPKNNIEPITTGTKYSPIPDVIVFITGSVFFAFSSWLKFSL